MDQKTKLAKAFHTCQTQATKKINTCFHPDCEEESINSHILQKNGILSIIAEDQHVIEWRINKYKDSEYFFKRIGINVAFSFKCFCAHHDFNLFEPIEQNEIDFSNYKTLLLFTLRTIYNEIYRKLINVNILECLIENNSCLLSSSDLKSKISQEELGINDLKKIETVIWNDLNSEVESFVFKTREISQKDICLSSFYPYETSKELNNYFIQHKKYKENITELFVSLFPYQGKSIYIMAYRKENEILVKPYINDFFSCSERKLEIKITNLMMFHCETWAISNDFYTKRIKENQEAFSFATKFHSKNFNERMFFDLNIFSDTFENEFSIFKNKAQYYLALNS